MGELKLKNQITSLELLEQVNLFREEEYEDKKLRGTLTKAEKKKR